MKTMKIIAVGAALAFALSAGSAMADSKKGAKLFKKKCTSCHSIEAGKHKSGPSLAGIVGKQAGTVEGFKKYKALKGSKMVWNAENLESWITNPKKFIKSAPENFNGKSTAMNVKIKKAKDRAAIIEFLTEGHDD